MCLYSDTVAQMDQELYQDAHLITRIKRAKAFMDEHYDSPLDLGDCSRASFISPSHLIRSFRKLYGLTPNQYLITVRIRKAKDMLRDGHSVTATCYLVGFESVTSFCGLFKKMSGQSPYQFIKRERQKSDFEEVSIHDNPNFGFFLPLKLIQQ